PSLLFSPSDAAPTPTLSPLSLHDALPIWPRAPEPSAPAADQRRDDRAEQGHARGDERDRRDRAVDQRALRPADPDPHETPGHRQDRKSTRLNSSHVKISYAVFCLKKKKNT